MTKITCALYDGCEIPNKLGRCIPICPFYNYKKGALRVRKIIESCAMELNPEITMELADRVYHNPVYVELFGERIETYFEFAPVNDGMLVIYLPRDLFIKLGDKLVEMTDNGRRFIPLGVGFEGKELWERLSILFEDKLNVVIEGEKAFLYFIHKAFLYLHIAFASCVNMNCQFHIINTGKPFDYREVASRITKDLGSELRCYEDSEDRDNIEKCLSAFFMYNIHSFYVVDCTYRKLEKYPSLERKFIEFVRLNFNISMEWKKHKNGALI